MSAEPVVEAPAGPVVGMDAGGGVSAFLGIPFAEPPIGARRFRAPVAYPDRADAIIAARFGPSPMQERSPYLGDLDLSEDCLTVNVWAPAGARGKPVLFWIYGGGFAGGSSASPLFDGARMAAEEGIVVVSANHRTGALGFASLAHRGLPEASNLGLLDVVSALEWVNRNISSFGGDPQQVTVAGQSSGAFLAAALLAVEEARNAFARLVLISGGASRIVPQERAEQLGDQLIAAAGVDSGPDLLDLAAEDIVHAQSSVGSLEIGARNAPIPDALGVVLDVASPSPVVSAHPQRVISTGGAAEVPMLFVVAGAEVASLRGPDGEFAPASARALIDEVASWGAPDPVSIVAAYDGSLAAKREQILTDFIYRLPAARSAMAQNSAGGAAWLAQVDNPDGSAASHDLPVRVLFGNLAEGDGLSGVSARARSVVARFVRGKRPPWRPFDRAEAEVLRISDRLEAVPGDVAGMLRRWEGVDRP